MHRIVILIGGLLVASFSFAESFGMSLSNESAEVEYNTGGDYADTVDFGVAGYFNSVKETKDIETSDSMLILNLQTSLEGISESRLLVALGGFLYALRLERIPNKNKDETDTGLDAGIGMNVKLGVLITTSLPSVIYAQYGMSPNIVNTGKTEDLRMLRVMYELKLSPASIFQLGYRSYYAGFDGHTYHLGENHKGFENSGLIGIKLRF